MTTRPTSPTDDDNPAVIVLSILVIAAGAGWLGYHYLAKNTTIVASIDTVSAVTVTAAALTTLVAAAHTWHGIHPRAASETEPEKWALKLPVTSATIATAAAAFTATLAIARWTAQIPLIPAAGLAAAATTAAAGFTFDNYRLAAARTTLRSTLIQALYTPLGHNQPGPRVVTNIKWAPKTTTPKAIIIRANRPMSALMPPDDTHHELDIPPGASARRLDPAITIRRTLRTYCHDHYRVSTDPSALVFTAVQFVPEQIDEALADLTQKVREIFEPTATVTGSPTEGFTVKHTIGKKLTGEFRKRITEQNLTELIGGAWRVKWDMPASTVTFSPKPELPRIVYPKAVPAVRSIAEAVGQYRQTRFAYGVDLDLGVQEWDPLDSPHTLVGGKTGAGKTVYLRTIIMMAALRGWAVVLVDFKGGSYSDLVGWPNVHIISSDPFESIATIHRMYKLMDDRNARARWDQTQWDDNLPYLVVVDEAAQFRVVLNRLWNSGLKPNRGPKEPPTLTELNEMARLSRTARVHLVLGMQRPDHDLIDTESRDNFGNRVSVGPISRIAAEMIFEDSYTGRFVPRIKGRGMSTGTHQQPRETQYYFTPPANSDIPEEAAVIDQLRPPATLIPRYVPELPKTLNGATWNEIAEAPWFPLSARPDLDPTRFRRKVTKFHGDSRLGFEPEPTSDHTDIQELVIQASDLQPKDRVSIDGHVAEVDGVDISEDGTVTVMWQDDENGRLCLSAMEPSNRLEVQRSSS
jgi:hypothetical protein